MAPSCLAVHHAARSAARQAHARWICPLAQLCAEPHCSKSHASRLINRSGLLALGLPTDLDGSEVCKKCSNRVVTAKAKAKAKQRGLAAPLSATATVSPDNALMELQRKLAAAEAQLATLAGKPAEKQEPKKPSKRQKPRISQKGIRASPSALGAATTHLVLCRSCRLVRCRLQYSAQLSKGSD